MHRIKHGNHHHEAADAREAIEQVRQCRDFAGRTRPYAAPSSVGVTQPTPPTPQPEHTPATSVPLGMLAETPDGYYAVRLDDSDPYRFLRIKRPTTGRRKGLIQVQTKHSDDLKLMMLFRPAAESHNGRDWVQVYQPFVERHLILAMVDPYGARMAFARELNRCCICGKDLTDERSRHYGIGPDCEKRFPDIIQQVDGRQAEQDEDDQ